MRVDVSIRVKGHLDPDLWQDYLAGLQVAHEAAGVSRLRGTLPDQPALYGVLRTLASLGLALLSVETDECGAVPSMNQKEKGMRKVSLGMNVSLDGYVAGPSGRSRPARSS
jgi:hypothetical protein